MQLSPIIDGDAGQNKIQSIVFKLVQQALNKHCACGFYIGSKGHIVHMPHAILIGKPDRHWREMIERGPLPGIEVCFRHVKRPRGSQSLRSDLPHIRIL